MNFDNPKLQVCVDLTMKEQDLRQRRIKLLQLLELIDKSNEMLEKVGAAVLKDDRAQLVRLLNQTQEFEASREAL